MSCIYFKFKSEKRFDSIVFDGPTCSLAELKRLVLQKKGLTKHPLDFNMIVSNAQTKQVYESQNDMIQRNSSVIIVRTPATGVQPPLDSEKDEQCQQTVLMNALADSAPEILAEILEKKSLSESKMNGNAFWIKQADKRYNSVRTAQIPRADESASSAMAKDQSLPYSNGYIRAPPIINGSAPHPSYVCHRCNRTGHFKHACPLLLESNSQILATLGTSTAAKRATGIPRSELIHLRSHVPGSYITSEGSFVIPRKEVEAILDSNSTADYPPQSTPVNAASVSCSATPRGESPPSPDLICPICGNVFVDAVLTPCCNENFCELCIRTKLLESGDNECPSCSKKEVAADQIFANKFLRKCVEQHSRRRNSSTASEPDFDQALVAVERTDSLTSSTNAEHSHEMTAIEGQTSAQRSSAMISDVVVAPLNNNVQLEVPYVTVAMPLLNSRSVISQQIVPTTMMNTVLVNALPQYPRCNQTTAALFASQNLPLYQQVSIPTMLTHAGLEYSLPNNLLPTTGFETDPKFQFNYVKLTLEALGIFPLKSDSRATNSTGDTQAEIVQTIHGDHKYSEHKLSRPETESGRDLTLSNGISHSRDFPDRRRLSKSRLSPRRSRTPRRSLHERNRRTRSPKHNYRHHNRSPMSRYDRDSVVREQKRRRNGSREKDDTVFQLNNRADSQHSAKVKSSILKVSYSVEQKHFHEPKRNDMKDISDADNTDGKKEPRKSSEKAICTSALKIELASEAVEQTLVKSTKEVFDKAIRRRKPKKDKSKHKKRRGDGRHGGGSRKEKKRVEKHSTRQDKKRNKYEAAESGDKFNSDCRQVADRVSNVLLDNGIPASNDRIKQESIS